VAAHLRIYSTLRTQPFFCPNFEFGKLGVQFFSCYAIIILRCETVFDVVEVDKIDLFRSI